MTVAFVVLLAQLTAQPTADLQAKTRAQVLLTEGTDNYEKGDVRTALANFEAAYGFYPSPKLWFNIGQARRDLGQPVNALVAFERFIAEAKDALPATISEARRSVAELSTKLSRLSIACTVDGAEVVVDGTTVATTPLTNPIWVLPGAHRVVVRREAFKPAVLEAHTTAGQRIALTAPLSQLPQIAAPLPATPAEEAIDLRVPQPSRTAETPSPMRHWPFWAAVGGTILLLGVFVIATSGGTDVPHTTLGAQRAF